MMKQLLKNITRTLGLQIKRENPLHHKLVNLQPETGEKNGSVLLAYILEPFLLGDEKEIPSSHTNFAESLLMADIFLELGYEVDVIDFENDSFIPKKNYAIFLSARKHFERYAKLLNNDCIKIVHLGISHWLYNNTAALKRCYETQKRKGVVMDSYRLMEENWAIESADYGVVLGNEFTVNTYKYAEKPIYRVPLPTVNTYPDPVEKDYNAIRRNYLWFGSRGFVHKGLDLVLDAFAGMPDFNLYVCGPIESDCRFEEVYHQQLYQTNNIETIGWVDINSEQFLEIISNCIGIVYPSCAEGGGGNVLTCMQAGVIPLVSYEASVDISDDYGYMMDELSVEEIEKSVKKISQLPVDTLKKMTRNAWKFVHNNNTEEQYTARYNGIIKDIMEKERSYSYT